MKVRPHAGEPAIQPAGHPTEPSCRSPVTVFGRGIELGTPSPMRERAATRRVLICESCLDPDHPALSMLEDEGLDLISCADGQTMLEEAVQHMPAVVIYALRPESAQDLGVLHLLRRVAPEVPLVLLATEGSLHTQRLVQSLRPIYYAVCPIEPAELRDAVRAAFGRQSRGG